MGKVWGSTSSQLPPLESFVGVSWPSKQVKKERSEGKGSNRNMKQVRVVVESAFSRDSIATKSSSGQIGKAIPSPILLRDKRQAIINAIRKVHDQVLIKKLDL